MRKNVAEKVADRVPSIQVVSAEAFEIVRRYQTIYLIQESKNKLDLIR